MPNKLRLIQAGVGGHGRGWLRNVTSQSDDVEVVAVADPNPEARHAAAELLSLDADRAFDDLADAVGRVEADAVLSVTPPAVHRPHAELALGHGLHLLVEKPLAPSLDDARHMVELADDRGLQLMVCQQRRWDPEPAALARLVRERPVGEAGHTHIQFDLFADFRGSFRQSMPHVLLVDMVVHHIDLIRHILGKDVAKVYAVDFNPEWSQAEGLYENGPGLKMVLTMTDGTHVSYSGDWSARGRQSSWQGDWRIQCERGAIEYSRSQGLVISEGGRFGMGATEERLDLPEPPAGTSQKQLLGAFAEACRTGEPGLTSGRDNLKTIAAVFAAVESCETGRVVDVPAV